MMAQKTSAVAESIWLPNRLNDGPFSPQRGSRGNLFQIVSSWAVPTAVCAACTGTGRKGMQFTQVVRRKCDLLGATSNRSTALTNLALWWLFTS